MEIKKPRETTMDQSESSSGMDSEEERILSAQHNGGAVSGSGSSFDGALSASEDVGDGEDDGNGEMHLKRTNGAWRWIRSRLRTTHHQKVAVGWHSEVESLNCGDAHNPATSRTAVNDRGCEGVQGRRTLSCTLTRSC